MLYLNPSKAQHIKHAIATLISVCMNCSYGLLTLYMYSIVAFNEQKLNMQVRWCLQQLPCVNSAYCFPVICARLFYLFIYNVSDWLLAVDLCVDQIPVSDLWPSFYLLWTPTFTSFTMSYSKYTSLNFSIIDMNLTVLFCKSCFGHVVILSCSNSVHQSVIFTWAFIL